MDAATLKIDGLASLTRQLGADINANTAAVQANTETMKIMARSFDTMAEAFHVLHDEMTAEPEESESLGDLLRAIHNCVTHILAIVNKTDARHP